MGSTAPFEMAKVAGDKLQIVTNGCGRDLNVCIRQDHAFGFEMSADAAENLCNGNVVRQNCDGWKKSLFDICQVTFTVLGAVRSGVHSCLTGWPSCALPSIRRSYGSLWTRSGYASHAGNGRGAVRIAAKSYRGDCSCILLHDDRQENHDPAPVQEKDQEDTAEGAWHSSTAYEGGKRC